MPSPRVRPSRLEKVFQYQADFAASLDLSGIDDPQQQWLAINRATLPVYGRIGGEPDLSGVTFTPVVANGVPAEWVAVPGASNSRRIVWIHGGGWAAGSPKDYREITAILARRSDASILVVDYRLSPEHPFPAGLDDCAKAFEWALNNGPESEVAGLADKDAAERIAIVGDSAGGNLSAATCVRLVSTGVPLPDRLVIIGATLDNVSLAERDPLDDPICSAESLFNSIDLYLSPTDHAANPEVSPVFATTETLEKFPPTLIQVSTAEALLYDCKKFARRLEAAGTRVNLSLWPEMPHVWHGIPGLYPEADEALAEIADFTRR